MTQTRIRSSSQFFVDADLDVNSKKITALAAPTVPSDAATKAYVDGILAASDALVYIGVIDCSTNPNYPAADAGHTYKASVAGKIGGASGTDVVAGDLIICTNDGTASGTQAAVGQYWDVIHVNAGAGTVTSTATTPLDNQVVRLDSTTGEVVQNSLATIDDAGSMNIPTGQTYNVNGSPLVTNATHTGDVTGSGILTIADNAVTLAKLATQAANTILANATAGAAVPSAIVVLEQTLVGRITGGNIDDLSATQVRTLLNVADGATNVTLPIFVTREAVAGTKNGVNDTFTIANIPTANSEELFINGLLLNMGAGNDYTISGLTITTASGVIPAATDIFLANYRY